DRDKALRLAALIILCALVYYFSFEQGRASQDQAILLLEQKLMSKDQVLENLSAELKQAKTKLAKCQPGAKSETNAGSPDESGGRITIRTGSSRTLFDGRLVLSCLDINQKDKKAWVQVNLVNQDRVISEAMGLGQSIKFALDEQNYNLVMEQIHAGQVAVQIIKR
ncbi:MAG: hypothetical protein HQK55_18325, partial [Deltaproteobacteria bacterium]|nr:hypothetical protein [Deltaproteobacteria bacterium]